MALKVVIVEDEPSHVLLLRYNLEQEDYAVCTISSQDPIVSYIDFIQDAHLIIVSVELDHSDGLSICTLIRDSGSSTPILFVSTSIDEVACACLTNLDYLSKPFSISDLMSKVRALIKEY